MCTQEKEQSEMTGHEAGKDMKQKKERVCVCVCEGERVKREPIGGARN